MKISVSILALLILLCAVCNTNAQDDQAWRVLDAAVGKLGGADAIRSLGSIYFSAKGTENGSALGQDYSAVKELVNPHREKLAVFLDGVRLAYEYKTERGDGTTRWRRFMFTDSRRIVADFVNKSASASRVEPSSADRNEDGRRIPHLLLLEVLSSKSTLRYEGTRDFQNRPHDSLSLTLPNTDIPVTLYFDSETHLLSKYEFSTDFPGLGIAKVEYLYSSYHSAPKLLWAPTAHQIRVNGKIWRDVKFESFAADTDDANAMMELPEELEGFVALPGTVKQIAKGVYFVYRVGGFQPMFVEFKDFVLAIEAPAVHPTLDETPLETLGNVEAVSDEFIAKIKQTIPNKPIRYVAITHAHSDHMGGLRAFLPSKSIVLAAGGDQPFYARFVPELQVEAVGDKRTITDGDRVVELISVGANPHTAESLVVYFPKEKFLFQGDLFYFNGDSSFPQKDRMTVMPFFAKWLKRKRLSPVRIYGFHSTLFGTMEHIQKLLDLRSISH
jgi:glyoxylase-like metal-dependent hydrolase (beta-lactamase superfamily II)